MGGCIFQKTVLGESETEKNKDTLIVCLHLHYMIISGFHDNLKNEQHILKEIILHIESIIR